MTKLVVKPLGDFDPTTARMDIGYVSAHDRLMAYRGKPTDQICAFHGDHDAQEWALLPDSRDELVVPAGKARAGVPYSADPRNYVPLCRSAHRRMDYWVAKERKVRDALQGAVDGIARIATDLARVQSIAAAVAVSR